MKRSGTLLIELGFTVLACTTQTTQATVIDFNGIPDGTPVTAGNPYAGVLVLESETGWNPPLFPDVTYPFPPGVWVWFPTEIASGGIHTYLRTHQEPPPPPPPVDPFWRTYFFYSSYVNGTFLQPVTDVSLDVIVPIGNVPYSYSGANGKGDIFTGGGEHWQSFGDESSPTLRLDLPDGFYLTEFSISRYDSTGGGAFYDFSVDNISFRILPVPDKGSSVSLLALSCFAVFAGRFLLGKARP